MSFAHAAERLLQQMFQDMERAKKRFQPTRFWRSCIPAILQDIELFGIENFYAHPSAAHTYAAATCPIRAAAHLEVVRSYAPHLANYSQSLVGRPVDLYESQGRCYSSTALSYLRALSLLQQHFSSNHWHCVLEIGGGSGLLGDILTQQGVCYINVDIPPLAAVSTYYLKALLGDNAVLDYRQVQAKESLCLQELECRAAVLCPWQLSKLMGSVDVAVNCISFQEMEPSIVSSYADEIKRLQAKAVLLRNNPKGKPGVDQPTTREHYLEFFSEYQLLAADTHTFGEHSHGVISEVLVFGLPNSRSSSSDSQALS